MAKLGSLNLEKLKHVKRQMKGKDGNKIDVLILPIKANGFITGEKSTNMNFKIVDKEIEFDGGDVVDGFITHERATKTIIGEHKKFSEMTEDEQKKVNESRPILGNFKDFDKQSGYDNAPEATEFDDEEDSDLPF